MDTEEGSRQRHETPAERLDRNYLEQVQELRVAQTGVQVLFAFLLSLPFLSEFPREDPSFRWVYTVAIAGSAASALCFIGPVAFHRILFRQGHKGDVVRVTNVLTLVGLGFLVVAMAGGCWLGLAMIWTAVVATWSVVALVALILLTWAALPLLMTRS